jgi:superfamily II DNA or RNA helicase
MKKQNRNYQKNPIQKIINLNGRLVLAMCPNSGKTIVSILGIDGYLKKNSKHKVLILAHSTNVIKKNFTDSLKDMSEYISFTWSDDLLDDSQVHVAIPAQYSKIKSKYDLVVVDEAHENYLVHNTNKGQVQSIIEQIGAKNELLLTGTPSKFILKGGYDIIIVSLLDMDTKYMATLGIELIQTKYNWKGKYLKSGNLNQDAYGDLSDAENAMSDITLSIISKIKKNLSAEEFNSIRVLPRVRGAYKSVMSNLFNKILKKTMFVCGTINQADDVNRILNNNGVQSFVSHSEGDESSDLFNQFKNNQFNVLVVVNRGRLGYSDDDLYNIVDMSGTHNPDLIYQMFARVLRGKPSQKKFYYKLTTQEAGMKDLTHLTTCAALMLTDRNYISVFNGSNFNGIKIPVIKNTETKTYKTKAGKTRKKQVDKITLPEFTNDIVDFMRNIIADSDKKTSVYKMTSINEIKRTLKISEHNRQAPQSGWTKEACLLEGKKYKIPYELNKANRTVYQMLRDNRWMHEVYPHFKYRKINNDELTMEKVIEILEKREFTKLKDLNEYNSGLYNIVSNNKELRNKYFPNSRIIRKDSKNKNGVYWTKERCIKAAKECSSRYQLEKTYKTAKVKLTEKWPDELDKIFPKKIKQKSHLL